MKGLPPGYKGNSQAERFLIWFMDFLWWLTLTVPATILTIMLFPLWIIPYLVWKLFVDAEDEEGK